MKIAIIGAGISGLSVGKFLHEKGHEVELFEKNSKVGGLVQCDWVEGNLFHKVGGHVFNAKDNKVHDWFWQFFDKEKEFIKAERNAKILLDGKFVGYPLENHLYALKDEVLKRIVSELLVLFKEDKKNPLSYPNFEAFLKGNFGKTLFDIYFGPYNEKIWKTDLSKVAMEWLDGKLPMPNFENIFSSNILRSKETDMVHSTFYYPRKGGSQFITERLAEEQNICLGIPVEKLYYLNGCWEVNEEKRFDRIIYTGDVRMLNKLLVGIDNEVIEAARKTKGLKSNGTSNLLCYTDDTDLSWLYLPGKETKAHRIIYTGNFSSKNNAFIDRKTCVVEFSGRVDIKVMIDEISKLPGNLVPVFDSKIDQPAYNYQPNSYVIQEENTKNTISELKNKLRPYGFFLTGRFAEWEYYNMDKAILSSMDLVDNIFV